MNYAYINMCFFPRIRTCIIESVEFLSFINSSMILPSGNYYESERQSNLCTNSSLILHFIAHSTFHHSIAFLLVNRE